MVFVKNVSHTTKNILKILNNYAKGGLQMQAKPERIPWSEFLGAPLQRTIMTIFGFWYCDYCQRYHSPRIRKYKILHKLSFRPVCSIGYKAFINSK